jgi:hypothetical protein
MNKIQLGALITCCGFYGAAVSEPSVDEISSAIAKTIQIEFDLAVAQKQFSVMKESMSPTEKCVAKDLLGASIDYREVIDEARAVGLILGDTKSLNDRKVVRHHLGLATSRVVSLSEIDLQIVNDSLANITEPAARARATTIRDKMIEARELLRPFASEK